MHNDDTLFDIAMVESKSNYDLRASIQTLSAKGEVDNNEKKNV